MTALALLNESHNRWKETHFHSFKIEWIAVRLVAGLALPDKTPAIFYQLVGILEARVLGV